MTVAGIIEQYNTERPNQIEDNVKVQWLRKFEMIITNEIIKTHVTEHTEEEIEEHFKDWDMDTELFVKEPYDDIYLYYMDQRIAFNNNDNKRYNVSSTLYNNTLLTYKEWFNKNYEPIKNKNFLINHGDL